MFKVKGSNLAVHLTREKMKSMDGTVLNKQTNGDGTMLNVQADDSDTMLNEQATDSDTMLNEQAADNGTIPDERADAEGTMLNEQADADGTMLNVLADENSTMLNVQLDRRESDAAFQVLDGIYTIKSKLNFSSGEADLYICTDGMDEYVAKIYRRKMAIKEEVTEKLKTIDSPYVAKVYATGIWNGYPYEILPYYKNGSLEGKRFSYDELRNHIIPALNEGLKVLHDYGIIHKDLKPSNIMLADNGQDVAIIDFGISSIREDGSTVIITRTGMTPEYSAPETFKSLFLSESDYYSLGVTLYELFCGHTPYEKMSIDEIEQFVSVQKLPLPADMKEELKVLISALTYPDITNRKNKSNPNRRWGYEEVMKWCVGIKQPVPGEISGAAVGGGIKPYKFLGETYTDKDKLIFALNRNWEEGKKQLFRGLLSAYFKSFDAEAAGFCMDAEEEGKKGDEDIIFFQTMYKVDPSLTHFLWKGRQYESLAALGEELLHALWNQKSSMDSFVGELLTKGVLSRYVLCMDDKDAKRANALKAIEAGYQMHQESERQRLKDYYLLAYLLSGQKVYYKDGMKYHSVEEITEHLKKAINRSYEEFETMCYHLIGDEKHLDPQFESWLVALGNQAELEQWKKERKLERAELMEGRFSNK